MVRIGEKGRCHRTERLETAGRRVVGSTPQKGVFSLESAILVRFQESAYLGNELPVAAKKGDFPPRV